MIKSSFALFAITGLDFSPSYIWLDDRGKFFALVNPWSTVIPEGWESRAPVLNAVQDDIANARSAALAEKFAHHVKGIVFTHANVFNAESGSIVKDQTVVVSGNRIQSLGGAAPGQAADVEVVDATGKTLIPGLWDMHTHLAGVAADPAWSRDALLPLLLANGITGVRDMGGDLDALLAWRRDGLQVVASGPMLVARGRRTADQLPVANAEEARAAVGDLKRRGADFVT